jgi:hypothetical protein
VSSERINHADFKLTHLKNYSRQLSYALNGPIKATHIRILRHHTTFNQVLKFFIMICIYMHKFDMPSVLTASRFSFAPKCRHPSLGVIFCNCCVELMLQRGSDMQSCSTLLNGSLLHDTKNVDAFGLARKKQETIRVKACPCFLPQQN